MKTIKQLEKEIEELRSMCASVDVKKLNMKEVSKLNCYIEIFVQQARLLQTKAIKKMIEDRIKELEKVKQEYYNKKLKAFEEKSHR